MLVTLHDPVLRIFVIFLHSESDSVEPLTQCNRPIRLHHDQDPGDIRQGHLQAEGCHAAATAVV